MKRRSLIHRKSILGFLFVLLTLISLVLGYPADAAAADDPVAAPSTPELSYMVFQSNEDDRFLIGETKSIRIRLYDQDGEGFSGSVTAYTSGPDGKETYYSVSGSQGNYTVSNVAFDVEGGHSLLIYDKGRNYAGGTIKVTKPLVGVTGEIIKNKRTAVTGVLKDAEGIIYSKRSITVDGTEAGISSSQSHTTAYDGTFSFWITPTKMGKVKFMLGEHEVGSIDVRPPYSHQGRIGANAQNNLELSIQVARAGWTSASTVILTRDDNLADALTAVPLSKKYDAPILMNPKDRLDDRILQEIGYLGAAYVMIIGGEGAIAKNIEEQLRNGGYAVQRIAGADRYGTSAQIAAMFSSSETVYLAYGHGEPDALAASSFAAINAIPILLTDKEKIPAATQQELNRLAPSKVVLLGGNGVIDIKVEADLKKNYLVDRWGGNDRYNTGWAVLRNNFTNESKAYFSSALVSPNDVASGQPFGDALLAATLAAKNNVVSINIPPNYLPKALDYFLLYNRGYISEARIIGNTRAISTLLERQIEQLLTR